MSELGIKEMEIDYSEVEVLDKDRNWDCLNHLKDSLKGIRNIYAHGGSALHSQVSGTFNIVNEIICQIYSSLELLIQIEMGIGQRIEIPDLTIQSE